MFHISGSQIDSRNGRRRRQDIVAAQEEDEALIVDRDPYGFPVVCSTCKFSNVCGELNVKVYIWTS
eukprot:2911742-Prorocentrum_lima.AAC.1